MEEVEEVVVEEAVGLVVVVVEPRSEVDPAMDANDNEDGPWRKGANIIT